MTKPIETADAGPASFSTDQLERIHAPLRPPPASVIREGVSYDTLMPPNAELNGARRASDLSAELGTGG